MASIWGVATDVLAFLQAYNGAITALATIAIGGFTLALVIVTNRQAALTRTAAEAAKLNAQAVVDSERARLSISVIDHNLGAPLSNARRYDASPSMGSGKIDAPQVVYIFTNFGKTPALLRDVSHGLIWEEKGEARKFKSEVRPLENIGPTNDSKQIICKFDGEFTFGDARKIVTGERALLFFGSAVFIDAFNKPRGVHWECRCSGGNFDLVGYYEYDPKK